MEKTLTAEEQHEYWMLNLSKCQFLDDEEEDI